MTHDFRTAAGLSASGDLVVRLDGESRIIEWTDDAEDGDPGVQAAFLDWFVDAHPDEAASLTAGPRDWYNRAPADMERVLMYIDAFVAQSDLYPVAP